MQFLVWKILANDTDCIIIVHCCFGQDIPYPMDKEKLGHAIIVNNIATEFPGSKKDVEALKEAYEEVGYEVQVKEDCTGKACIDEIKYYKNVQS